MRLTVLTSILALSAGAAFAQAPPAKPSDDKPIETQSSVAPFGGSFESRLGRLDSDIQIMAKDGKLPQAQAQSLAGQVEALRAEVKAVRDRNGGELPDAENERLQASVTALHDRISALTGPERTTTGAAR